MSYKSDLIPIGSILAWTGGYFTAAGNGGTYTNVLGNTIAAANSYLEPRGFRVCNGDSIDNSNSPIFNGANKFLPDLTDNRFLHGSTTVGSIGGQNSVTLTTLNLPSHTHTINHDHGPHSHTIDHDHGAVATGAHTHTITKVVGPTGSTLAPSNSTGQSGSQTTSSTTPSIDIPNFTGSSGGANISFSGSSGSSGSGVAYENRPNYLSIFYIIRIV